MLLRGEKDVASTERDLPAELPGALMWGCREQARVFRFAVDGEAWNALRKVLHDCLQQWLMLLLVSCWLWH